MPRPKNTALRVIVPMLAFAAAIGVAVAVFTNSSRRTQPAQTTPTATAGASATPPATVPSPAATPAPVQASPDASASPTAAAAQPTPAATPSVAQPATPHAAAAAKLVAAPSEVDPAFEPLGSTDPASGYTMELRFSPRGAGLDSLRLAGHYETIRRTEPVLLQSETPLPPLTPDRQIGVGDPRALVTPFAWRGLTVDGQWVELAATPRSVWTRPPGTPAGVFRAFVRDGESDVLAIERRYELSPGDMSVRLVQSVTNVSGRAMKVQAEFLGPIDLPLGTVTYGGDTRRIHIGYLLNPQSDPSRVGVLADDYNTPRAETFGKAGPDGWYPLTAPLWPNPRSIQRGHGMVWIGMTNRYFGLVIHSWPPPPPAGQVPDLIARGIESVDRVVFNHSGLDRKGNPEQILGLRLRTPTVELAAGARTNFDMGVFAGPQSTALMRQQPVAQMTGLERMVVYRFPGPCGAWCTFAVLTDLILWLLRLLHDYLVFDWALAIILLVVIVRTLLHPVTKWSQIRMARFGKQMQKMAPKMQELKKKFANDSRRMQEETAKLWREEGVSPLGMLGCIPIFLQMPIWIALSATLFFAADLRHQGALWGVFQQIQPSGSPLWHFMGDLSEPDRLWYWGRYYSLPVLSWFMGEISSLNILPFVLGVVFFIQQKYLTPPMAGPTSPEQELQMKMMKWMSVFLFPLFMYNAPSGLSLYFLVNSTLAILESRYIRAHIDANDLLNPEKFKKKGGGFFVRLQEMAVEAQKRREELAKQQARAQSGRKR